MEQVHSKCGEQAIKLNSIINSFIKTQRLTLSQDKSVVVHIGNKHSSPLPCPKLSVDKHEMKVSQSAKYLGNFITTKGGHRDTIEDRRNKGWGKIASIQGILEEVDLGKHRVEVGLLLRKAILVNSLLFTAETWSGVKNSDLVRLEHVDLALLSSLVSGHSKCAGEFTHMELGTLKLRHILTKNRLMFHHHLLSLDENETLRKIYEKQKINKTKGDWFCLLQEDFSFIGEAMNEDLIKSMSKCDYKIKVTQLVQKAAFQWFSLQQEGHKKTKNILYEEFKTQPYLTSKLFNNEERNLLYSLRSKCHPAKNNFRKMNRNNLFCSLGCQNIEDQFHIFKNCPILSNCEQNPPLEFIFGDILKQKEAIDVFLPIDKK